MQDVLSIELYTTSNDMYTITSILQLALAFVFQVVFVNRDIKIIKVSAKKLKLKRKCCLPCVEMSIAWNSLNVP